ncbi:HAD-IA family hydrolase [Gymnodinialimonas sp. 2305UL16-5]|uniref:HAD family hydrolase n=1 Tax=Gymnodinialimonas mytili TaxID=3126503 RepID=UPI0030AAD1EE
MESRSFAQGIPTDPAERNDCGKPKEGVRRIFDGIEAVCFDAFGTLVEIEDKRGAFRVLLKALSLDKRRELKNRLMRETRPLMDWPEALGVDVAPDTLLEVRELVSIECSSIALRSGMAGIWARLRREELRLAICSNLASDYVAALQNALPDRPEVEVFSCRVGAIKPEPAIYAHVLQGLGVAPNKVLFVGDTLHADINGPRRAGMNATRVDAFTGVVHAD